MDFRQELEALLIVLPPKRRKIFVLYKDGMKHKEIAEMLSLSEKTVRNNIERAVRQLKDSAISYGKVSPLRTFTVRLLVLSTVHSSAASRYGLASGYSHAGLYFLFSGLIIW